METLKMNHREKFQEIIGDDRNFWNCILDLHMYSRGSLEGYTEEWAERTAKGIKYRLDNWINEYDSFDISIKNIAEQCLENYYYKTTQYKDDNGWVFWKDPDGNTISVSPESQRIIDRKTDANTRQ